MITRKVKLAFVAGLDLIYIHKAQPLSHTGLHSPKTPAPHPNTWPKNFFSVERQFLKKLVLEQITGQKSMTLTAAVL